jgi:membrane fusion protein (multidrug efflux system)
MKSPWLRRVVLAVVAIGLLVGIYPAINFYQYFETHVSTDDAYVDGTVALVSSRVAGTVTAVYVEDNWTVKQGDLLIILDPRDFQVRVDQAQAMLARAKQSVDEMFAALQAAEAGLNLAQSQAKQARLDYQRAEQLRQAGVVSTEYYDQAVTAFRMGEANVALAEHQVSQARAALGGAAEDHARYDRPIVQQAQAALEAATLDLAYTRITAPFDGIITHKSVHVGHRVQAGEPLMADVPTHRLYVTANYKETQLTYVRVGQKATVEADIYPDHVYHGHVDSISMGTGAAFSLLPPENATGNWVKVVQRVPVKVVLDEEPPHDRPLRLGLSVEVAIDISDTRGPLLTSIVQRHFMKEGQVVPNERLPMPPLSPPAQPGEQQPEQHRFLHQFLQEYHQLRHR